MTEADALSITRGTLFNSGLDGVNVSCSTKLFPAGQVTPFITGTSRVSSSIWAVVVTLKPNGAAEHATPNDGPPPGSGTVALAQFQIYFVSSDHPLLIYGVRAYPAGLPLPTVFAGMG